MGVHRNRLSPPQLAAKKAQLFALLVERARLGKVCPSLGQLGAQIHASPSTVDDLLGALRAEKKLSWTVAYCGTGVGAVRVVTIGGKTTARPPAVKRARPRATGAGDELERAKDALVHAREALNRGECVVIYPEGTWYTYVDKEDIDEIVDSHIVGGKVVERLKI